MNRKEAIERLHKIIDYYYIEMIKNNLVEKLINFLKCMVAVTMKKNLNILDWIQWLVEQIMYLIVI